VFLRFLHLDADFPLGLNWSADVYTDEGWYSNAATRHVVSGEWYLAGDLNQAINMPLGQLLHRMAFSIFGLSLFSARISEALAFVAVIVFAALIVRQSFGVWAGLLTALILASNYLGFAFSRLAIMEPVGMGFVMASLFLAQKARGRKAMLYLIAASLLAVAAALVKTTMIFAIPLVAYFAWVNGENRRERFMFPTISLFLTLFLIGGYHIIAWHFFKADYSYFAGLNLRAEVTGLWSWLVNILRKMWQMLVLGKFFLGIAAFLIAAAGVVSPQFRRNPIVHVLIGYGVIYFSLLTTVWYGPPRYFLPLIVPLASLTAIACVELTRWLRDNQNYRRFTMAPSLLVAGLVLFGSASIVSYMSNPSYSYLKMTAGVNDIIRQREGSVAQVIVFGDIADQVALETGVRAMNTGYGVDPMVERLERYHPPYLILHVAKEKVLSAVRSIGGQVTQLGEWDVYENFYRGEKNVKLFSVVWSEDRSADNPVPRSLTANVSNH
jgi:4-amino-4-deoxy-L-arabinose transferase-like glycosyltransferase